MKSLPIRHNHNILLSLAQEVGVSVNAKLSLDAIAVYRSLDRLGNGNTNLTLTGHTKDT